LLFIESITNGERERCAQIGTFRLVSSHIRTIVQPHMLLVEVMLMSKVFINPGHGGKDPGATGNGLREKDITLAIGRKIVAQLNDYEVQVKLFRSDDTYYSLEQICQEANKWKANLFISVHVNAGGGTGYEDYIYSGLSNSSNTAKLRNTIHAEVIKQLPNARNRGKKKANFYVLRNTNMSAMLTENLFIDNKTDANRLKSDAFLTNIAKGHVNGIVKALALKKKVKSAPKPSDKSGTFYRVVTGSFKDKTNATKRVNELKKLGYDSFIDPYKKNK